jgi:hypothetical protein
MMLLAGLALALAMLGLFSLVGVGARLWHAFTARRDGGRLPAARVEP